MKTNPPSLLVAFIFVALFASPARAAQADPTPPPRLTVELRDGSRVVGTSVEKNFKFHSALLGKIKLDVNAIRSVECVSSNTMKLTTTNGDLLTVSFADSEFAVKTSFGRVELAVDSVRMLSVTLGAVGSTLRLPGLVALWSGEGNADDSAGGNNGVLMDGVGFEPGMVGQAFHFSGNDDSFVKVPDSPSLRLTDVLTITFWFKKLQLNNRPHGEHLISKGGNWNSGGLNYGVATDPDDFEPTIGFFFAGGNRHAGSITDTNWHYCAVIATNGEPDPVFYIDGVIQPITRREGATRINLYPSTQPLYIGAQVDPASGWNFYSKTLIDELAIYNRALSESEIQTIFREQNNGELPPPAMPCRTSSSD